MLLLALSALYLLLAASDIIITSRVIRQHEDLNVFTQWLLKHTTPFGAAFISISIPTFLITLAVLALDLERTQAALIGARLALLTAQVRAHGPEIIGLKTPSGGK